MLQNIKRISASTADLMGISASVLCLIHCLAFPLLISFGFFFGAMDEHGHEHWHWLDYLFIGMAIIAVFFAAKNAHNYWIKVALWITVLLFSGAVLLHEDYPQMLFVSATLSIVLALIHTINWKNHRKCALVNK
jgi:hypothetical protein